MGMFVEGVRQDDEKQRNDKGGSFQRPTTSFRSFITTDGSPGPTGSGGFKAEAGRYHHRSDTGVPSITSARRARVALLVSPGMSSGAKKPCATIS